MKSGEVVHIRVNADDVMGCIDVVDKAGAYVPGMSIAQVIRMALSGLVEAARKHEVIPRRDGFEYTAMMARFQSSRTSRKLQISNIIESAEQARAAIDRPHTIVDVSLARPVRTQGQEDLFDELVGRKARLLTKQGELQFKMKADPLNFTPAEQMELDSVEQQMVQIDMELDRLTP